jgi:hypothetical protein
VWWGCGSLGDFYARAAVAAVSPLFSHVKARHCRPSQHRHCWHAGWAPAVAELNAGEMGWLLLAVPHPCTPSGDPSPRSDPAAHVANACPSQQQLFRHIPRAFLEALFTNNSSPPTLVVAYDGPGGTVGGILQRRGYRVHRRLHNCWWQTDEDTPCLVVIWTLKP